MKTKAIVLVVVLGVVCGLWAGAGASSAPFEFHAAGESLASDVSGDFVYRASGETLATLKSDAFGYRASGEAVVSVMAVESATYRAVGDVLAFGTSATFAFQAVGEAPVKWHHLTEFCLCVLARYGIETLLRTAVRLARCVSESPIPVPRAVLGRGDGPRGLYRLGRQLAWLARCVSRSGAPADEAGPAGDAEAAAADARHRFRPRRPGHAGLYRG